MVVNEFEKRQPTEHTGACKMLERPSECASERIMKKYVGPMAQSGPNALRFNGKNKQNYYTGAKENERKQHQADKIEFINGMHARVIVIEYGVARSDGVSARTQRRKNTKIFTNFEYSASLALALFQLNAGRTAYAWRSFFLQKGNKPLMEDIMSQQCGKKFPRNQYYFTLLFNSSACSERSRPFLAFHYPCELDSEKSRK